MRASLASSGKARAASSSSRKRNRSGAFRGNATNATGEPITDEQRRELTAISRAAGVVMYVIANSNVLNIGGGCNVEQNLIVQGDATFQGNLEIKGDLTVRGKIYAASDDTYSPPTPVPTHVPTTPMPTFSHNPTEAPTARPTLISKQKSEGFDVRAPPWRGRRRGVCT